jgi:N-acetylmuramoyl-L-alanine amidase
MFTKEVIIIAIVLCLFILQSPTVVAYDVCIDPGHGGVWGGTDGYDNQGPNEKDRTLDIALKFKDLLLGDGYDVWMTRTSDASLDSNNLTHDLEMRAEYANGWGPNADDEYLPSEVEIDAFVSIHLNAFSDTSVDRTETYYSELTDLPGHVTDYIVAVINGYYVNVPPHPYFWYEAHNGGTIERHDLIVLETLDWWTPGCLTEVLFYTNYEGWVAMKVDGFRQQSAKGVLWAIEEFSGGTPVEYVNVTVKNSLLCGGSGGMVKVDDIVHNSPFDITVEVGDGLEIQAISPQTIDGTTYYFDCWSDGGALKHHVYPTVDPSFYTAYLIPHEPNAPTSLHCEGNYMHWTNNSCNESGFQIWEGEGTPPDSCPGGWQHVGTVGANKTSWCKAQVRQG